MENFTLLFQQTNTTLIREGMHMQHFKLFALLAVLLALLAGCSNDDKGNNPGPQNTNSTTWDEAGQYWKAILNADGSSGNYAYYSFTTRDVVTLTDAEAKASSNWHIAFKKSYIKTNGGFSGPGDVKAVDLTAAGVVGDNQFAEATAAKLASLEAGDWMSDAYDFALDSLWNYNPITHQLTPKRYVYVLSDAAGNYVKFQLLDVLAGQAPPQQGQMVLKYTYQPVAASLDLSGSYDVDTIDQENGFYFDFSSGQVVTPGDPANSTDWDIRIYAYDVYLNGSIFGIGQAAAFPIYDGLQDRTDFDAVNNVNQFGPPRWVNDEMQSAFTVSDWYNYNFSTHQLTSKRHTYVVQTGGKNYKVEIVSYYDPDTQASGTYTINWAEI